MLRRIYRIDTQTYKTLSGRTTTYQSPSFVLYIYKNPLDVPTRYAVVCSKKIDSRAVMRNTIRRRVYSVIKKNIPTVSKGFFMVFMCKKSILQTTYPDLSIEILDALHPYTCR
jgi:ribonuclease P protein component